MNLTFVPKEAGIAYVADRLWLPKSVRHGDGLVRSEPVRRALEFIVGGENGIKTLLCMWQETKTHIICPREFLPPTEYLKYRFPFVDLRPQFQSVRFEDRVDTRSEEQAMAWRALAAHENGILNLGCGKGKTVLAVKKIAKECVPTLVVVPDGGILEQWKMAILGDKERGLPARIGFDGDLGMIQGPQFSWAKPITLALVTTLWRRIEEGGIPEEMFKYFGLIIYDEVHQIGAPKFSLSASPFFGNRIGLTATVEREDGLDPVYRYHIGEPFYSDVKQDLIPDIYFQKTPVTFDHSQSMIGDTTNISLLRTQLGRDLTANAFRYWCIRGAVEDGRKILVLSHSKDQLKLMHAMFPGSGLITQETKQEDRLGEVRNNQLCFAISRLGSQGVDDDALDALFCLTPFRSKNNLQQSMGRIQRSRPGKKHPFMVVFDDKLVPPLRSMVVKMKSLLKEWHFTFTVVPVTGSKPLPHEVQIAYNAAYEALPSREESVKEGTK